MIVAEPSVDAVSVPMVYYGGMLIIKYLEFIGMDMIVMLMFVSYPRNDELDDRLKERMADVNVGDGFVSWIAKYPSINNDIIMPVGSFMT